MKENNFCRVTLVSIILSLCAWALIAESAASEKITEKAVKVLEYQMEEGDGEILRDSSAFHNDATAIGLPFGDNFKWIPRKDGGHSLKIGNDAVSKSNICGAFIPNSESLRPEKFVIDFDIKPYITQEGRPADILSAQTTQFYYKKPKTKACRVYYPLWIKLYKGNRVQLMLSLINKDGKISARHFTPTKSLPSDKFTKVRIIVDKGEVQMFFDKKMVGKWDFSGKVLYDHPDFVSGHVAFKLGARNFDGELDNFTIYDLGMANKSPEVGIKISTDKYLNFFAADETKAFKVGISNFSDSSQNGILNWRALDHEDKEIGTGKQKVKLEPRCENEFEVEVPSNLRGCFRLQCDFQGQDGLKSEREEQYSVGAIRDVSDHPDSSPFGVDAAEMHGAMSKIPDLGMKWVRPWLGWHYLEPEDGVWKWEIPDRIIDYHHKKGQKIMVCLFGTPSWAVSDEAKKKVASGEIKKRSLSNFLPVDPKRRKQYLEKIVSRYKDQVDVWEVWNEANTGHWRGTPEEFVEMTKQAHEVIRRIDPSAKIAGPSICKAGWDAFSGEILELGVAKYFDIFIVHYIGGGYTRVKPEKASTEIQNTRKMINTYGKDLTIWDGESGFHVVTRNGLDNKPYTPEEIEKRIKGQEAHISMALSQYASCRDEITISNAFVRKVVLSISEGVNKHFRHNVGRMKYEADINGGRYRKGSGVLLPGIAWAAMVEKLANAEFVRKIDLKDDKLFGFIFKNRDTDRNIAVFWSSEGKQNIDVINFQPKKSGVGDTLLSVATLGISGGKSSDLKKFDVWGNPGVLSPLRGDRQPLELSEAPFYLDGISDKVKIAKSALKIAAPGFISSAKKAVVKLILSNPFDSNLDGKLEIQSPDPVKIEPKNFTVKLAKGEKTVKEVKLLISPEFKKEKCQVIFSFNSVITGEERKNIVFRVTKPPFKILPKTDQIAIDAKTDDKGWKNTEPMILSDEEQVVMGRPLCYNDPATIVKEKEWFGPKDLSAKVLARLDDKNLYLLVKVKDQSLRVNQREKRPFLCDGIEIFIDGRPEKDQINENYTLGSYHLFMTPADDKCPKATWIWGGKTLKDRDSWPIELASERTDDGYIMEVKIPLNKAQFPKLKLENGRILGFDICVNDADGQNKRKSQISWRGTKNNFRDASRLGKVVLKIPK